MFSWYWNKTVQFLERCPWQEGREEQSEARTHNDQYPFLHSLNIELFDNKLDLTALSSPADNSTQLLLIKFQRLSRIIQLFRKKWKTLQSNLTLSHRHYFKRENKDTQCCSCETPETRPSRCQEVQTWGGSPSPTCAPQLEMKPGLCAPSIGKECNSFGSFCHNCSFLFIAIHTKQQQL